MDAVTRLRDAVPGDILRSSALRDHTAMEQVWYVGEMPGLREVPCLVSWRNGMALVVPLVPLVEGRELAPFSMPGWYDEGTARDVEEACTRVAEHADSCGDVARRANPYPNDVDGVSRFLARHGVNDPGAAARLLSVSPVDGDDDGPVRHVIPEAALAASPLSSAAVDARDAREREVLAAYPDPAGFEGADADLLSVAVFARKAASRHPRPGSLAHVADKSALRALDAVRGTYPPETANSLLETVLHFMARDAVAEPTRASWLDGQGLEAARAALARHREGLASPAPR